jgi:hypothetical protein
MDLFQWMESKAQRMRCNNSDGYAAFTAVTMKSVIFWYVTSCNPVEI